MSLLLIPSYHTPLPTSPPSHFQDQSTTHTYTLSLHDALPISGRRARPRAPGGGLSAAPRPLPQTTSCRRAGLPRRRRSEEHTSELQSRRDLVCRLLLEKKKSRTCRIQSLSKRYCTFKK